MVETFADQLVRMQRDLDPELREGELNEVAQVNALLDDLELQRRWSEQIGEEPAISESQMRAIRHECTAELNRIAERGAQSGVTQGDDDVANLRLQEAFRVLGLSNDASSAAMGHRGQPVRIREIGGRIDNGREATTNRSGSLDVLIESRSPVPLIDNRRRSTGVGQAVGR